jgi:hypothetical protein
MFNNLESLVNSNMDLNTQNLDGAKEAIKETTDGLDGRVKSLED